MKRWVRWTLGFALVAALAVGGYAAYSRMGAQAQSEAQPAIQTARVRTGDITISAAGSGVLVPSAEVALSFRSTGLVSEVNVEVGSRVVAGDVLARLDDTAARIQVAQAELNLQALTSPFAVAQAEIDLSDALVSLEEARYANLTQQEGYRASQANLDATRASFILAQEKVDKAEEKYAPLSGRPDDDLKRAVALAALSAAQASRDAVLNQLNWMLGQPDDLDQAGLDASVAAAEARVNAAQALLVELKGEAVQPGAEVYLGSSLTQLRQASLTLESAQAVLQNTQLVAPMDGLVTSVEASPGEMANTSPVISLAAMDQPMLRFYLEETDLGNIAPGYPVNIVFDAAPDLTFTGKVLRVDPVMATVDGGPAVQAWAQIDPLGSQVTLVAGMSAEVEVVAGQALKTLLVPVQALRELEPGSYAVFMVGTDGELTLTPVTVGLKDYANAEILDGLQAGDVVSTGTVETQ